MDTIKPHYTDPVFFFFFFSFLILSSRCSRFYVRAKLPIQRYDKMCIGSFRLFTISKLSKPNISVVNEMKKKNKKFSYRRVDAYELILDYKNNSDTIFGKQANNHFIWEKKHFFCCSLVFIWFRLHTTVFYGSKINDDSITSLCDKWLPIRQRPTNEYTAVSCYNAQLMFNSSL